MNRNPLVACSSRIWALFRLPVQSKSGSCSEFTSKREGQVTKRNIASHDADLKMSGQPPNSGLVSVDSVAYPDLYAF